MAENYLRDCWGEGAGVVWRGHPAAGGGDQMCGTLGVIGGSPFPPTRGLGVLIDTTGGGSGGEAGGWTRAPSPLLRSSCLGRGAGPMTPQLGFPLVFQTDALEETSNILPQKLVQEDLL